VAGTTTSSHRARFRRGKTGGQGRATPPDERSVRGFYERAVTGEEPACGWEELPPNMRNKCSAR